MGKTKVCKHRKVISTPNGPRCSYCGRDPSPKKVSAPSKAPGN